MTFGVGTLVRARGREWVVLPESKEDLLVLRPLGGTDDEVAGVYLPLEKVEPARFDLPDPRLAGDHRSCRLLRDAVRLTSRAGAGPFRCFARIAVEPRPYQIVPLLMALRLDPVRLLIADDVGIGKTIEACLIARELLDRGEVSRLAVLCPPHLADQWQRQLSEKFHIEAELVLPGTADRLERGRGLDQSLFDLHPFVVVSTDFIKSDRHRDDFVRAAPELLIVDEAHTCAFGGEGRGARHQRHQLLARLAADPTRHLILVSATPHSGKEEAFRSLLTLLRPDFASLPADLTGQANEAHRRRLAAHFVQRRRGDIRHYLKSDTPFPERKESEATYRLSPEYRALLDRVLAYARETVRDQADGHHRQRVRWWSALALMRSIASSPAAAASTLRKRARVADTQTEQEADAIGRQTVLDLDTDESSDGLDVEPGADHAAESRDETANRRRLLVMAQEAEALEGRKDLKMVEAIRHIEAFVKEGRRPIIFCRFIPTAEYLSEHLRESLPKDVAIAAVTGLLPPGEREARIRDLAEHPKRVLVCTDCLSEGIDLQEPFDAVMHYDLSWNPTRHEQREGRVDRFGQPRKDVAVLTYYGVDNVIDGIVLEVLIRKHRKIRSSLGISVPVPSGTTEVAEAIFEGLLRKEQGGWTQDLLPGLEAIVRPRAEQLTLQWDAAADREKRSRTMFAQESIKVDEVARELAEACAAAGGTADVQAFTEEALRAHGGTVTATGRGTRFDVKETPRALRDHMRAGNEFTARFELPTADGVLLLSRTHPLVEGLAAYVLDTALDPQADGIARRCGATRTDAVSRRTTLLLVRFRFDVITTRGGAESSQLAEECRLLAFAGSPEAAEWLDEKDAEALLAARPAGSITPDQASGFVAAVVAGHEALLPSLRKEAGRRAEALLDAHRRVRSAAGLKGVTFRVEPQLPADLLGIYVFLPAPEGSGA